MTIRDITRDEMSAISGYSTGVISNIRNGRNMNVEQLLVFCQVLEVSPNFILGFASNKTEIEQISHKLQSSQNPDLIRVILEIITLSE